MEASRDPGVPWSDMFGIGREWWLLMSVSDVRIVTVATVRNLQAWRLLHPLVRLGQPACPVPDNRHRPPNVVPIESTLGPLGVLDLHGPLECPRASSWWEQQS